MPMQLRTCASRKPGFSKGLSLYSRTPHSRRFSARSPQPRHLVGQPDDHDGPCRSRGCEFLRVRILESGTGGGAGFPTLPNPAQANPPPLYTPNIDAGLLTFDTQGVAHTIDWWALRAGVQYYLPPTGRLIVSVNYTLSRSGNMAALFPKGGAEIELLTRVADISHYAALNLLWDATAAIRVGLSGQYTKVRYLDGDAPHNLRATAQGVYAF